MSDAEHARCADWDGAYVLGALTPGDRHVFERHLEECERCRDAVAELAAMPGLLAQIRPGLPDGREVEPQRSEDADSPSPAPAPPSSPALSSRPSPSSGPAPSSRPSLSSAPSSGPSPSSRRSPRPGPSPMPAPAGSRPRRRRRRLLAGALAAAAAVALAIVLPSTLADRGDEAVVTVSPTAAGAGPAPMQVDVELAPTDWGTAMTITCAYPSASPTGPGGYRGGGDRPRSYALVLTAEDGTRSQVSSWQGVPGETVVLEASTALDLADIAAVSVLGPGGTTVLRGDVDAP